MTTAEILTDAWLVHYNFFKEHESLGNIPPAQKMGIPIPFKNWAEVVNQAKVAIPVKPKLLSVIMAKPSIKRKPPKRKPKGLKQRAFIQASVTTFRK